MSTSLITDTDLVNRTQQIGELCASFGNDDLALAALLAAFGAISEANPCCTEIAAQLAISIGKTLLKRAGNKPSSPLH